MKAYILLFALVCCHGEASTPYDPYNITWNTPSRNSSESMPTGGGDIGCNVWVENGEMLAYFQRSGSFNEIGEYLKMGRLRIRLSPNPFLESQRFRQELKLHDGYVEISATGKGDPALTVNLKFWVEVKRPVIHLDIDTSQPVDVKASYENWRIEDKDLKDTNAKERFGAFTLEGYPGRVTKLKDSVAFDENAVLFFHRNPEKCLLPGLLIEQQGLQAEAKGIPDNLSNRTFGGYLCGDGFAPEKTDDGQYLNTPFRSWTLKSESSSRNHRLRVATHVDQTSDLNGWKKQLLAMSQETSEQHAIHWGETMAWWHQFWERSWIFISTDRADPTSKVWQAGRNYNLVRYQLGCNALGDYPSKFNGGNFTFDPMLVDKVRSFDPDWRAWGGDVFTAQNQRLLYWPMLKSGDFDAIQSQFKLYQSGLPGAKIKVKSHFGHEGAMFCEYMNGFGLDFGAGWGWPAPSHRTRGSEVPFGDPMIKGIGGYQTPVEHGIMANGAVSYHWESQVEHAYMMLEYHRFTGADLRPYMPFIEASLVFFDQHYQLRQKMRNGKPLDENGKLVFFPSTSCESYRGAKNPADLIAGICACLDALLDLDDSLLSVERKSYYRGFRDRMPGFYFEEHQGDRILKPAETWMKYQNVECPQFYPLFPFNRFDIDSPEIQVFRNTWKHGTFAKNMVQSWHQDGIFFARMGMTEEAADFNVRKLQDSNRRFPTFWGPGHDWVPDHNWGGSGMIGLQEMLLQTIGNRIFLLPAWPRKWDVSFKLHAPGQTTIECIVQKGKITHCAVRPPSRRNDIIISQPFQ